MKKLPSPDLLSVRNIIRSRCFAVLLVIAITAILYLFLSNARPQAFSLNTADGHDMLAYVSSSDQLMLYDPRDRTETALLDDVRTFKLGLDGRVAFTKLDENDTDLYIFDPSTDTLTPVTTTENTVADYYPLAWSPDGRYLAFVSFIISDDSSFIWNFGGSYSITSPDQSLYVWDGEQVISIMPENELDTANGFYATWSHDRRLAFTIDYSLSSRDTPAEIYLWDGNTTINLSQNPEGWDGAVSWSSQSQLLFASRRGDEDGYYVWDGVSFKDGLPDADTFIPVASELEPSSPIWIADGLIAFTTNQGVASSKTKTITMWDMQREVIVEQYSVTSDKAYSSFTEGGRIILSNHLASGLPSYYLDVENIEGQILFTTVTGEFAWSPDGYLAYCTPGGRTDEGFIWILSLSNGKETWDVARVSYRPAQWQSEQYIFSCNNG